MVDGTVACRKKPTFRRKDWHKKIRLGSKDKKNVKWKSANGRHNKIRLGEKGHIARPKIGWSNSSKEKGKISGLIVVRVENMKQLENVKSGQTILIASVGKKKKMEMIAKANEKKLKILNKYRRKE